jgi:hypothetical protein
MDAFRKPGNMESKSIKLAITTGMHFTNKNNTKQVALFALLWAVSSVL